MTATNKGRILLVDDDEAVLRSTRRLLARDGYDVLCANNGREALVLYQGMSPRPDVVVMDVHMPEVDGEQAMELLLQIERNVRILFVTGTVEPGRENSLLEKGARAVLRKPFDGTQLRAALAQVLN